MNIITSGHHLDLTEGLKSHVNEKFARLDKHFSHSNPEKVHVVLRVDGRMHHAEASLHLSGKDYFAESKKDDMYAAIDDAAEKLDRQLRKFVGKKIASRHKHGGVSEN